MKTIKELSDITGISRVSIYNLLKRDDLKHHVFKRDNVSVVDDVGTQIVLDHYSKARSDTLNDIAEDVANDDIADKRIDVISLLQSQLREKDVQINTLLNIVSNQQRLQATQYLTDKAVTHTTMSGKPKRFFGKLFKRGLFR